MGSLQTETSDVLIIGCSMISMTLASLLAEQGISCIAVEKHATTAIHPRSAMFQPKSVQLFERMGMYDRLREEAAKTSDERVAILEVESLAGKLIQKFTAHANDGIEKISPVPRLFLSQMAFEPLMKENAMSKGADLRFSSEMINFKQSEDGVLATIQDKATGKQYRINAKYMISSDGSRSQVREDLGISKHGYGLLSHCATIYFEADLYKYIAGKYNGVIYVTNEALRGVWRLDKTGKNGFMFVVYAGPRGSEESKHIGDTITHDKAMRYLYDALGVDDEPFKITFIDTWDAVCEYAASFRSGRVFLMGDAAHTVPPHGGFGGNAGIQDAQNLAWKLAMVIRGQAGTGLLDTYEQERLPMAQKTVNQVFCRWVTRSAPELREQGLEREQEIDEPFLELGYKYLHSDAIIYDGREEDMIANPATAEAAPGNLAHHVVATPFDDESPGEPVPVLRLLSHLHFVLLAGEEGRVWINGVKELVEKALFKSIIARRVGGEEFVQKYGISRTGAALIRPDGFVAWRCHGEPRDGTAVEVLQRVMDKILQRT